MTTIEAAHSPSNIGTGNISSTNNNAESSRNGSSAISPTNGSPYAFPAAPRSPTKDALKPNAHPYAIKTTSTALLSRSNSSPHYSAAVQHHYIPKPPPSPSKDKSEHQKYGGRHRYSRSLTSNDSPRPLPVPIGHPSSSPTHGEFAADDFAVGLQPTGEDGDPRYSTTIPTSVSSLMPVVSVPPELGLPEDPKLWTPSQLAAFLATPFGLRGLRDAQEAGAVAEFVEDKRISGRIFLRLNEDDLERHSLPPNWRHALLTSSRDLRQSQLQKRIWGSSSSASYTNATYVHPSRTRTRSDSMSSDVSDASTRSSISASSSRSGIRERGRGDNGRVKGMVQSFERSSSVDEGADGGFEGHRYSRSMSPNKRTSTSSASAPRPRPGSAIFPSQTGGSFPAYPKGDYMPERRGSTSPDMMHSGNGSDQVPWLTSSSKNDAERGVLSGSPKKEPRLLPYPPVPPVLSPETTGSVYGSFSPQVTGLGFDGGFTPQATGTGSFISHNTGGTFPPSHLPGPFNSHGFAPQLHSFDYGLASIHPTSNQGDFDPSASSTSSSAQGHMYTGIEGRPLPYPPHQRQVYQPHVTGNSSVLEPQADAGGSVTGHNGVHQPLSPPDVPSPGNHAKHEEEPSIEELLASEPGTSAGAEAWELELGDTVKKITATGRVTGRTGRRGKGARNGIAVDGMFGNEDKKKDNEREISEREILEDVLGDSANGASKNAAETSVVENSVPVAIAEPSRSQDEFERRRREAYELEQERERERQRLAAIQLEEERLAREQQERAEQGRTSVEGEPSEQEPAHHVEAAAIEAEAPQTPAVPSVEHEQSIHPSSKSQRLLQELDMKEAQLLFEIDNTRRMAEELKSRVEVVEKKIEGMEERERQRSQAREQERPLPQPAEPPSLTSFVVGAIRKTLKNVVVPILGDRTPEIVADFVGQPRNRPAPPDRRRKRDIIVSKGGYLVLFSIGMCAVVLRVLLRRVATFNGKRLGGR